MIRLYTIETYLLFFFKINFSGKRNILNIKISYNFEKIRKEQYKNKLKKSNFCKKMIFLEIPNLLKNKYRI